jgi:hypothetical protein
MAVADSPSIVAQIGETAGLVWKALVDHGAMTTTNLIKVVGQPRDTVMQSVGWLAREDKIEITLVKRVRMISLR